MNTPILKNTISYICIFFMGITSLSIPAMSQDVKSEYTGTISGRGGMGAKINFNRYYNNAGQITGSRQPVFFLLDGDGAEDCSWFFYGLELESGEDFVVGKTITVTGVTRLPLKMPSGQKPLSAEVMKESKLIYCRVENYTIHD